MRFSHWGTCLSEGVSQYFALLESTFRLSHVKTLYYPIVVFFLCVAGCRSSILEDPTMTIPFSVAQASHVTLTIENSYNTIIATLVDADMQPGQYHVVYDANSLQQGIYFYTVECRGLQSDYYLKATQKILLLK